MNQNIVLKNNPKIEFQLLENGFKIIDGQTEKNTGFYPYGDLQSIELNKLWFPRLRKWLRAITWVLNTVPFFPDEETYKKANIIIKLENAMLGIWLTNTHMADMAKKIKLSLDEKINY